MREAKYSGPELCRLSARKAVALLRDGKVSPGELVEAALARIEVVEPDVNALPTVCADRAMAAAKALKGAYILN